jgi:PKD repeat protein
VVSDVVVETDAFLTIEPGVVVKFANGTNLTIDGALVAQGNSTHTITFTSNATTPRAGNWGTVRFRDTSIDNACILEWAIIEYASAGITIYRSSPKISNSILRYNVDGFYSEADGVARISNSDIFNNTYGIRGSFTYYYYYYPAYAYSQISNSRISKNTYGVNLGSGYLMIQESIISNNIYGIYSPWATVRVLASEIRYNTNGIIASSATISKSIISNNNGSGVSPYWYRYGNTTYYYDGTFSIAYSTITRNKENGLVSKGSSTVRFSNIYENTPYDVYNAAPFSWTYGDVNATNNWWGTTNTTEIDENIYDYYDDYNLKKVFYQPFLDSPVTIPPIAHDVAITNVTASPTVVERWQTVYITVYIVNEGDFDENVTVTARYDSVQIGTWRYMYGLMPPGTSTTASFYWYLGVAGNYTISAEVNVVPGETDIADNVFIDGVVTVKGPPPQPPYASFSWSPYYPTVGGNVTFDASMSYDPDGYIVSHAWEFGDNTTGSGRITSHVYTAGGTYTVTLKVTDNDGLNATSTQYVTVEAPVTVHDIMVSYMWVSPTYVYVGETVYIYFEVYNQGNESETFDVYVYADENATIIGDEIIIATWTDVFPYPWSERYFDALWDTTGVEPGYYTISVKVPPVLGEVDTADNTLVDGIVTVVLPPPVASFSWQPKTPYVGDTVVFDASASYDPDGTIVSYYWDFGDGTTANTTEPIIEHTYSQTNTCTVTLTVTDNDGLTSTTTNYITVIHRVLSVKLSGEFDYLRMEPVNIRLAALVRDAQTMEPFSNAVVNVEIYDAAGKLWISAQMQEKISGSGIYEWTSTGTIGQLRLSKGVYLVRVNASFRGGPMAYDILLFHIDPPAEGTSEILYYIAFAVISLAGATGIVLRKRQIVNKRH